MTLSELTNELKVELLNASDATYDENMWLSIEEIHRIRIGISKIDDFEFDKSKYRKNVIFKAYGAESEPGANG